MKFGKKSQGENRIGEEMNGKENGVILVKTHSMHYAVPKQ